MSALIACAYCGQPATGSARWSYQPDDRPRVGYDTAFCDSHREAARRSLDRLGNYTDPPTTITVESVTNL